MKMRKSSREITDRSVLLETIQSMDVIRLAFNDQGKIYIVPLNFGLSEEEGKIILYMHGAKAGRKKDLIEANGYAAFEMDGNHKLVNNEIGCDHTFLFDSVIGDGKIEVLADLEAKRNGLKVIMKGLTGRDDFPMPDKMIEATDVFKLTVDEICGKHHDENN